MLPFRTILEMYLVNATPQLQGLSIKKRCVRRFLCLLQCLHCFSQVINFIHFAFCSLHVLHFLQKNLIIAKENHNFKRKVHTNSNERTSRLHFAMIELFEWSLQINSVACKYVQTPLTIWCTSPLQNPYRKVNTEMNIFSNRWTSSRWRIELLRDWKVRTLKRHGFHFQQFKTSKAKTKTWKLKENLQGAILETSARRKRTTTNFQTTHTSKCRMSKFRPVHLSTS